MFKRLSLGATVLGLVCGQAAATWSILIVDTRTGEMGLASATCLTNLDLLQLTPVLLGGVGGATAQSAGDTTGQNRTFIRDRLIEGVAPADILPLLAAFDTGHQSRQYGIIDPSGGVATFTGSGAGAWAGGVTGQVGDLVYAVQGNVLTGDPVVLEAEQAIITTPGDLPEKLMAAMEAARAMGGDGRCSCNSSTPTACGAPPPGEFKSADVGYMIVTRAGDFQASNGVYSTAGDPVAITTTDFSHDAKPDVVAARFDGTIFLFANNTPPGSRYSMLTPAGTLTGPLQTVAFANHDVDGDNIDDLLVATASSPTLRVFSGKAGGGFAFAQDAPTSLTGAGADVAVGMGGVIALTATTLGVLDPADGWALKGSAEVGPAAVRVANDPLDHAQAFVVTSTGLIHRVRRTGDVVAIAQTLTTDFDFIAIEAGDVNADGRTDLLAVANNDRAAVLLLDDGAGGYTQQVFDLGLPGRWAMMADFDGDGDIDPAPLSFGFATLFIVRNDDNQTYTMQSPQFVTRSTRFAVATDMNGDGLPEVVSGGINARGVAIGDNLDGEFARDLGTAAGDYFLRLNIAGARRTDPDPVFQLQDQFDLWRADLLGSPDAMESHAAVDVLAAAAGSTRPAALNITLRDWTGAIVDDPQMQVIVEHEAHSAGTSTIGQVESLGSGRYRVLLTAGQEPGLDVFRIRAIGGVRPVTLMPSPTLQTVDAAGDFDQDGVVSFFDLQAFLNAFSASHPSADLNTDGVFDIGDVTLFLDILSL
jgi:hypothetical protein